MYSPEHHFAAALVRASNAYTEIAVAFGASSCAALPADQFNFAVLHIVHFVVLPLLYIHRGTSTGPDLTILSGRSSQEFGSFGAQ